MSNLLSQVLPFAHRKRAANPFDFQFQKIAACALSGTEQLMLALKGAPEAALERIIAIEASADDSVREVHRLVDTTFIAPYDKRDIIKLAHRLDRVVDSTLQAARSMVSYRALQATDKARYTAIAIRMCSAAQRSVVLLKQVVDDMMSLDADDLRESAREIVGIERECDTMFAEAVAALFPDPNQPLTVAMLAWRDVFQLLERISDHTSHAVGDIISIARQEGN